MKYLKKLNEFSTPQFLNDETQIHRWLRTFLSETDKRQGYFPEYNINTDGSVDVDGSVFIENQTFEYLPIKFGNVVGSFYLTGCINLKNLQGSPRSVFGTLKISNCGITSLQGAPEIVKTHPYSGEDGFVIISNCKNLKSLEGFPYVGDRNKMVGSVEVGSKLGISDYNLTSGHVFLSELPITTLEGLPKEIEGGLTLVYLNELSTLEGCPQIVRKSAHFHTLKNLISTKGITKYLVGRLFIEECKKLVYPDDLRDLDASQVMIEQCGLSILVSQFPNFKKFQESLDFNYIKKGDPENPKIDLFRFKQAWEECDLDIIPYITGRKYKFVNDQGVEVDFDGNPI